MASLRTQAIKFLTVPRTDVIEHKKFMNSGIVLYGTLRILCREQSVTHLLSPAFRGRILGRNWNTSLQSFPPCFSQPPLPKIPPPPPAKVAWNWFVMWTLDTETSSLITLKIMPRNLNGIVRSWIRLQNRHWMYSMTHPPVRCHAKDGLSKLVELVWILTHSGQRVHHIGVPATIQQNKCTHKKLGLSIRPCTTLYLLDSFSV